MLLRCLLLILALVIPVSANKDEKKDKFPSLEETVKDAKKLPGFFNLYQSDSDLYLEIGKAGFEKDFYFFSTLSQGSLGYMMPVWTLDQHVLYFKRIGNEIGLFVRDTTETAKRNSPENTAVQRAFLDRMLYRFRVAGASKGEASFLIPLHEFLYSHGQQSIPQWMNMSYGIHGLDERQSFISQAKAFPENLEIEVQQTLRLNPSPWSRPASNQVRYHYSFVNKKKSDFRPRIADERIGYFTVDTRDWSSILDDSGMKRNIVRWPLEKADPSASASVVKQPIVFYLDKSIPFEYRSFIRAGILEWNLAFEKLGFLGAIEARLPENGLEFDPADSRYATVSWAASNVAVAFGPNRHDPQTGEILDADVVISAGWLDYMNFDATLMGTGGNKSDKQYWESRTDLSQSLREYLIALSDSQIPLVLKDFFPESKADSHFIQRRKQATEMFVLMHSQAARLGDKDFIKWKSQFIGAYLKDLTMHEIGHALGLRHNFKASALTPFAKLKDPAYLKENTISASVMDYNDLLVTVDQKDGTPQLMATLGAYDYVAIEYGYKDLAPKELERQLNGIAQSLVDKGLDYASDEDTWGSDPHVQTYDLGDDLLATAKERLLFGRKTLESLDSMFLTTGSRMDQLERAIWALVGDYYRKTMQATQYIGGIHKNRDRMGDPKQRDAQVPVSYEKQVETLQYLKENVFGELALKIPQKLLVKSRTNPWSWNQPGMASSYQRMQILVRYSVLNRLLGSSVLNNLAEFHEKVSEKPFSRQLLFSSLHSMIFGNLSSTDLPTEEVRHTQRFFASQLAEFVSGRRFVDDTSKLLAAHTLDLMRVDAKDRLGKLTSSRDFDSALLRRHLTDLVTIADTAFEAQIQKHRF